MTEPSNREHFRHLISPFSYEGTAGSCLLLHGYTGSPSEMKPLGEFLAANGYAVSCPLLPGHGTTYRDLDRCTWHDWYGAVEREWSRLKERNGTVYILGLSMGGALALHLAAHREVDAVVTLASGVKLKDWRLPLLPVLRRCITKVRKTRNYYARGPNRERFAYDHNPAKATHQLVKFYRHLYDDLPEITAPILIINSRDDIVLPFENTGIIAARVQSTNVKVVALDHAKHIVTLSDEKDIIHREVLAFLKKH